MKGGNARNLNASAALKDRTRLTFTGKTSTPALSADGKQADLKRATMGWADYRGDAWMYRVGKP
jgi:hypothetical protein